MTPELPPAVADLVDVLAGLRGVTAIAPRKWRFCRSFSLDHARMHARRGDLAGTLGQAAKAALEESHAVLCARREWACNEKGLLEKAGLAPVHARFASAPAAPADLLRWVDAVAGDLGTPVDEARPWR